MSEILQTRLPSAPWMAPHTRRLPGIQPLDPSEWLVIDEAYATQMAERERLMAASPDLVHALMPEAREAAEELYDDVVARLPGLGFGISDGMATCPDGRTVALDRSAPLMTLGRLLQEDFCLMQKAGDEYVLTGAILCFPSGWTLAEKLGRPMTVIHGPVAKYDDDVARRVGRLFDAIRTGQPLWRANAHFSAAPLFHPLHESDPKEKGGAALPYVRSERQCLLRLPRTGAVVFSIHTYIVRQTDLPEEQRAGLAENPLQRAP